MKEHQKWRQRCWTPKRDRWFTVRHGYMRLKHINLETEAWGVPTSHRTGGAHSTWKAALRGPAAAGNLWYVMCKDDWNIDHRKWSKRCPSKEDQHKNKIKKQYVVELFLLFLSPFLIFCRSVQFAELVLLHKQSTYRYIVGCRGASQLGGSLLGIPLGYKANKL